MPATAASGRRQRARLGFQAAEHAVCTLAVGLLGLLVVLRTCGREAFADGFGAADGGCRAPPRGTRVGLRASKNPFDVLGIPRTSGDAEVRAAFREKAKMFHPDVPGTGDSASFQSVQEAKDELSTDAGRARWSRQQNWARQAQSWANNGQRQSKGAWGSWGAGQGSQGGSQSGKWGRQTNEPSGGARYEDGYQAKWRRKRRKRQSDWEEEFAWQSDEDEDEWEERDWEAPSWGSRASSGWREKRSQSRGSGPPTGLERQLERLQWKESRLEKEREKRLWSMMKRARQEVWSDAFGLGSSWNVYKLSCDVFNEETRKYRQERKSRMDDLWSEPKEWEEAEGKRWVERFQILEEESRQRQEQMARDYMEKIQKAKEDGRSVEDDQTDRWSFWRIAEEKREADIKEFWTAKYQEAAQLVREEDEDGSWDQLLKKLRRTEKEVFPEGLAERIMKGAQAAKQNRQEQDAHWRNEFMQAAKMSVDSDQQAAQKHRGKFQKVIDDEKKKNLEWLSKQSSKLRRHRQHNLRHKETMMYKYLKQLRQAEIDNRKKEQELEAEWMEKLWQAQDEALGLKFDF